MSIHVAPLPGDFLRRVRSDGRDALGQPVRRLVAQGNEPCRDVLRRARPGEELILASFSPFVAEGPFHEYGPVYVLANASGEEVGREALPLHPPAGSTAEPYLREQFVLRAYSEDESILSAEMASPETAGEILQRFLDSADVAFIHARFPLFGCFACRIDRA